MPKKNRTWVAYTCKVCGKTFYRHKNVANEKNSNYGQFCSRGCKNTGQKTKYVFNSKTNDVFLEIMDKYMDVILKTARRITKDFRGVVLFKDVFALGLAELYMATPRLQDRSDVHLPAYIISIMKRGVFNYIYPPKTRDMIIWAPFEFDLFNDRTPDKRSFDLRLLQEIYDWSDSRRYAVFLDYLFGGLDFDELNQKYRLGKKQVANIVYYYKKRLREKYDY